MGPASNAVTPMMHIPQPGTAVKAELRSMAWRMTRKCSSATGSSEVGGRVLLRRQGRESGIAAKISARKQLCQVLYIAKLTRQTRLAQIGYASPAMAPKRILLSTISLLVSLVCISSTSSAQAIPGPLATAKQIQNMLVQRVDV